MPEAFHLVLCALAWVPVVLLAAVLTCWVIYLAVIAYLHLGERGEGEGES